MLANPQFHPVSHVNSTTRATVMTFGTLAGLFGLEHALGEILQGNVAPRGMLILSWPESNFLKILAGEPAMTVIPNLLFSGILTMLVCLIYLTWATIFVQRRSSGLVLILLSIVMLLVGGGFGPPLLGIVATQINSPLTWWHTHVSRDARQVLGQWWSWSLAVTLLVWLLLFPGLSILGNYFTIDGPKVVPIVTLAAFGFLLLTILIGFAHDAQDQTRFHQTPSMSGSGHKT
jgi:hypothetical protein